MNWKNNDGFGSLLSLLGLNFLYVYASVGWVLSASGGKQTPAQVLLQLKIWAIQFPSISPKFLFVKSVNK